MGSGANTPVLEQVIQHGFLTLLKHSENLYSGYSRTVIRITLVGDLENNKIRSKSKQHGLIPVLSTGYVLIQY